LDEEREGKEMTTRERAQKMRAGERGKREKRRKRDGKKEGNKHYYIGRRKEFGGTGK
jgi:hypothetical protein